METLDFTHDPAAQSWVESANGHRDFPVQNLPLGVFSLAGKSPRGGVAIGEWIVDLAAVAPLLEDEARAAATLGGQATLNALLGAGRPALRSLRHGLFRLLTDWAREREARPILYPAAQCRLHLPVRVGDFTDFYAGIHHALNVGRQFRPDNPLLPNYKFVPIGYHGRASSIRPSGTEVVRPNGQTRPSGLDEPSFGPCRRLDYELEMAIWVGRGNSLGSPIPIGEAGDHIAGVSLLNDWSARDIQMWEYQPLGPFLAKNFSTTVAPWIVTMDALAPFRTAQPARLAGDPAPLPYLWDDADQAQGAFGVTMEVYITTAGMRDSGSMAAMYWTAAQLVAHHSSNGCDLQPGDLLGTGTLSGPDDASKASLLELSDGGKTLIALPNGETRTFLEDGDEIIMTAFAESPGRARIGFGECRGMIRPAP